jgi:hypothetical protein
MNNRKLIAEALLEIAKKSTTEFIEDSKVDKELIDAAKKIGIVVPSPDLSIFKTTYCEIDKVNLNGVILPHKAVEEGLPTLIGKNCNWEHDGSGFVCGYTIDAKIKDDKIETINVIFKSLFPDQAEELKEKVKSGEAAVSFEIWNKDPETGKSVVKELKNGFKEISPIIFHGTGVLLIHKPACPTAKIFKLVAKNLTEAAEKVMHRVFEEDLVFAQMAIEEPRDKEENKVELEKLFANVTKEEEITFELAIAFYYASEEEQAKLTEDAAKWTRKFINNLPDSAFAVIEPAYPEKIEDKNTRHLPHHNGEGDLGKDKSNENLDLPHYKNALARVNQIKPITDSISAEELQEKGGAHLERHKDALEKAEDAPVEGTQAVVPAEETKPADAGIETTPVEAQAEVVPAEPAKVVKIVSEESVVITETPEETGSKVEKKGHRKTTRFYSDGKEEVFEEDFEVVDRYTFAQLEEKVNAAKAEKDAEIATLKTGFETEKADLKTATENLDKEIKKLQDELGKKDQEIAELKTPKVEPKKEGEMTVGAVETEKNSEVKRQAAEVNKIIASKHDQK